MEFSLRELSKVSILNIKCMFLRCCLLVLQNAFYKICFDRSCLSLTIIVLFDMYYYLDTLFHFVHFKITARNLPSNIWEIFGGFEDDQDGPIK